VAMYGIRLASQAVRQSKLGPEEHVALKRLDDRAGQLKNADERTVIASGYGR